jgi:hypothetical protein
MFVSTSYDYGPPDSFFFYLVTETSNPQTLIAILILSYGEIICYCTDLNLNTLILSSNVDVLGGF